MIAASGTPRFRSNSGHTLAGTRVMTIPETMARSEMGNLAQRLGAPFCVVICRVLGTVADELTLSTSTTNSPSSPVTNSMSQIGDAAISRHSATRVTVEQEGTKLLLVFRRSESYRVVLEPNCRVQTDPRASTHVIFELYPKGHSPEK